MVAKICIRKDCEEKEKKLQIIKRLFSNYLFDVSSLDTPKNSDDFLKTASSDAGSLHLNRKSLREFLGV